MRSLAIRGIWKRPDELFEVYWSHHPRLVLFICHCPSLKATRISACGAGCELCPLLVWSSPGWLQLCGQPCSCSDPGSSVLTARLPRAQAAAGVQQLPRFSKLFIQLAFSAWLEPQLLGLKPAHICLQKWINYPSLEIWCWDVNCGVLGECLPALP